MDALQWVTHGCTTFQTEIYTKSRDIDIFLRCLPAMFFVSVYDFLLFAFIGKGEMMKSATLENREIVVSNALSIVRII